MYEYMVETVEFIYKNLSRDKNVLVYCENANQNAPASLYRYQKRLGENPVLGDSYGSILAQFIP